MNSDLERMAREAKLDFDDGVWLAMPEELQRFAELVRADERERCAKVVDKIADETETVSRLCEPMELVPLYQGFARGFRTCAAAIRNSASRGAEGEKT